MNEKLQLALEKLNQNEKIKKEIEAAPPQSVEELIDIGERLGVDLTEEDLKDFGKLSAEDIDQIAGGEESKAHKILCEVIFYA